MRRPWGGQDTRETFDALQAAVFHFGEFEGPPQDQTANENHAAVFLGGQGLPGVIGNSVVFNGGTDKMIFDSSPSLNFSNGWTVSAWVKINQAQSEAYLYSQQGKDNGILVAIDDTHLYVQMTSNGKRIAATEKSADIALGSWHFVTVTAAPNDRITVYIDGIEINWTALPTGIPDVQSRNIHRGFLGGES